MKKALVVLLSFVSVLAFAQHDEQAKEILDKVSAQTKSHKTISVEYTFTHENIQEEIKETSKGALKLKSTKYVLEFLGNTVFCDGATMWSYIKDANEVNISTMDEDSESLFNPAKMFTVYEEGFKYKYIGERFEKGHALYVVDLYPENVDESEYSKVRLLIDKDKNEIFQINYFGKDENRFIIEVLKVNYDTTMEDAMFTFKKADYPGVEIVDMR